MNKIKITNEQQLKDYLLQSIPATFNANYNGKKIIFQNGDVFELLIKKASALKEDIQKNK